MDELNACAVAYRADGRVGSEGRRDWPLILFDAEWFSCSLLSAMNLTLPDDPALNSFGEAELRLELAVALFASGRISRNVAARIAAMDRFRFDEELFRRNIPSYTREMVEEDLDTLKTLGSL